MSTEGKGRKERWGGRWIDFLAYLDNLMRASTELDLLSKY